MGYYNYCYHPIMPSYVSQGIADSYRKLHPNGSATVTQFQPRPQLLVREQLTHRPTVYTYGEAVFSPVLPPPTPESLRYSYCAMGGSVTQPPCMSLH